MVVFCPCQLNFFTTCPITSKTVGVSQWHGYTDYQKPHTGIDFSVAKQETRAVGNGVVIAKGYDTYYGKCHSGGCDLIVGVVLTIGLESGFSFTVGC